MIARRRFHGKERVAHHERLRLFAVDIYVPAGVIGYGGEYQLLSRGQVDCTLEEVVSVFLNIHFRRGELVKRLVQRGIVYIIEEVFRFLGEIKRVVLQAQFNRHPVSLFEISELHYALRIRAEAIGNIRCGVVVLFQIDVKGFAEVCRCEMEIYRTVHRSGEIEERLRAVAVFLKAVIGVYSFLFLVADVVFMRLVEG